MTAYNAFYLIAHVGFLVSVAILVLGDTRGQLDGIVRGAAQGGLIGFGATVALLALGVL
jgi:hypothetical protein